MKIEKGNWLVILFVTVFVVEGIFDLNSFEVAAEETEPLDALILLGTAYGFNYYDLYGNLTDLGFRVTVAGTSMNVTGCYNKERRTVAPNMTISEVTPEILAEFECVVIPSGGHHYVLKGNGVVQDLLRDAHLQGSVIATVCIGQWVLAYAHDIVAGADIAYFSISAPAMITAGANLVYRNVVSSKGFITSGAGGGPSGGGYTTAPTKQVCDLIEPTYNELRNQKNKEERKVLWTTIGISGGGVILLGGIVVGWIKRESIKKLFKK